MNVNKTFHDQIEDTDECRSSLRKAMLKYMRPDLPPEAQTGIAEFVDLIVKVAGNEFVCKKCLDKYQLSGKQGFIL